MNFNENVYAVKFIVFCNWTKRCNDIFGNNACPSLNIPICGFPMSLLVVIHVSVLYQILCGLPLHMQFLMVTNSRAQGVSPLLSPAFHDYLSVTIFLYHSYFHLLRLHLLCELKGSNNNPQIAYVGFACITL